MKNLFISLLVTVSSTSFSQNFNEFPMLGTTANPYAFSGIGTSQGTYSVPQFNFQIHGWNDFIAMVPPAVGGGSPLAVNYGKTARFGMTNSISGKLATDGAEFRMSDKNLFVTNQEATGDIRLAVGAAILEFKGATGILNTGGTAFNIRNVTAKFNVWGGNKPGLNIKTTDIAAHALGIEVKNAATAITVFGESIDRNFYVKGNGETFARKIQIKSLVSADNSLEVYATNGITKNVTITPAGFVFARKYTTTLANIPDYVFDDSYKLLSFQELKTYIEKNKHLPNIPSAKEIEANNGEVDLGELNRLLLEKVEEMTLYILQMEERLKVVENNK